MKKRYAVWGLLTLNIYYVNYTINSFNINYHYFFHSLYFLSLLLMGLTFFYINYPKVKVAYYLLFVCSILIAFFSPIFNLILVLNTIIVLILLSMIQYLDTKLRISLKHTLKNLLIYLLLLLIYINYFVLYTRFNIYDLNEDYELINHMRYIIRYLLGIVFLTIYIHLVFYVSSLTSRLKIFKKNNLKMIERVFIGVVILFSMSMVLMYISNLHQLISLNKIRNFDDFYMILLLLIHLVLIRLCLGYIFKIKLSTYKPIFLVWLMIFLFPILFMNDAYNTVFNDNTNYLYRNKTYSSNREALCVQGQMSHQISKEQCIYSPVYQTNSNLSIPHFYTKVDTENSLYVLFQKEILGNTSRFTNKYFNEWAFGKVNSFIYQVENQALNPINISQLIQSNERVTLDIVQDLVYLTVNNNDTYLYNNQGELLKQLVHTNRRTIKILETSDDNYLVLSQINEKESWAYENNGRRRILTGNLKLEKVDQDGNILWSKVLSPSEELSYHIVLIEKNGVYFVGQTMRYYLNIHKLNANGELISKQRIDCPDVSSATLIDVTPDGHYLITNEANNLSYVTKLNNQSEKIWELKYTAFGGQFITQEDSYLVSSNDMLIKYDLNGEMLWSIPNVYKFEVDHQGNIYILTKDKFSKIDSSGNLIWETSAENYSYIYPLSNGNVLVLDINKTENLHTIKMLEYNQSGNEVNVETKQFNSSYMRIYFDEQDGFILQLEDYVENNLDIIKKQKIVKLDRYFNEQYIKYFDHSGYFMNTTEGLILLNRGLDKTLVNEDVYDEIIHFNDEDISSIKIGINEIYLNETVNLSHQIRIEISKALIFTFLTSIVSTCLFVFINKKLRYNHNY